MRYESRRGRRGAYSKKVYPDLVPLEDLGVYLLQVYLKVKRVYPDGSAGKPPQASYVDAQLRRTFPIFLPIIILIGQWSLSGYFDLLTRVGTGYDTNYVATGYAGAELRRARVSCCPSCGSRNIRRSGPRGLIDWLLRPMSVLPYRCRACHSRFRLARARLHGGWYCIPHNSRLKSRYAPPDAALLFASGLSCDSFHSVLAGTKSTETAQRDAAINTTKVRTIIDTRDTRQLCGING